MSNTRNILFIISGLGRGGAEKVLFDLCRGLDRKEFIPMVLCLGNNTEMLADFENAGIETRVLGMRNNPVSVIRNLGTVSSLLRHNKVDIIHAHMVHALVFSVLLQWFHSPIPLVFTPHSIQFGSSLRRWLLRLFIPFRTRDILFSHEQYRACFRKDYLVIPNGIDLSLEVKPDSGQKPFTLLSVGRLEPMKNHEALIPVIRSLRNKYPFEWHIAGSGSREAALRQAISGNDLEDTVKLLGFRPDVHTLYSQSHAFLMPSLWEGMPIALLEAGLAGLPVAVTPVGSIPSLIDPTTGYIGPVKDFPHFLTEMLENYPLAREKGRCLRERIFERYSLEAFIQKHQKMYQSLVEKSFQGQ